MDKLLCSCGSFRRHQRTTSKVKRHNRLKKWQPKEPAVLPLMCAWKLRKHLHQPRRRRRSRTRMIPVCPVSTYFQQRMASGPRTEARSEDEIFCDMLKVELGKVQNPTVKRALKRRLLDSIFTAQEEEEKAVTVPQSVQYIYYAVPGTTTGTAESSNTEQSEHYLSTEDVQLLLHLHQPDSSE